MSVYLDTSALVPLFLPDSFNARIEAFLILGPSGVLVSDLASAEFASVVGIRLRTRLLTTDKAKEAFSNFDSWVGREASEIGLQPSDIREAQSMLRRLDLVLRAPDAIHLAIARRLGASLATFDADMLVCARILGIPVAPL